MNTENLEERTMETKEWFSMIAHLRSVMLALTFTLAIGHGAHAQTVATVSAVESSHVICSTVPCQTYGGQINNTSASALWVMVFDAASAPTGAGAAVTGCANAAAVRPCVLKWYQIAGNATLSVSALLLNSPYPFKTGLVVACSSTGPFTLTYSANCAFSWEVQQ